MTKPETLLISEKEKDIIHKAADVMDMSFEEASNVLFSQGLAQRSKKKIGKKPSRIRRIS